jgi:hypothetical protein
LGGSFTRRSGTHSSKSHRHRNAFCCFSLTTSIHPTHARTSRPSAGPAVLGSQAPIQITPAQDHRLLHQTCHKHLSKPRRHSTAFCGTPEALAAGTGISRRSHKDHSVATREAAQRPGAQLRRIDRTGMHSIRFQLSKKPRSCSTHSGVCWSALLGGFLNSSYRNALIQPTPA